MGKHTEGPWEALREMTGAIPLARKPEDWEATCYVASQEMFVGFFLQWEDAKLSAAASELLAACKSLSRLGEDPRSCMFPVACPGPEVEPVDMCTCKACNAVWLARAAIAKAEGRTGQS